MVVYHVPNSVCKNDESPVQIYTKWKWEKNNICITDLQRYNYTNFMFIITKKKENTENPKVLMRRKREINREQRIK